MRPYVLDNVWCEICHEDIGVYLCPELPCLLYYCVRCWFMIHQQFDTDVHKPVSRRTIGLLMDWRQNQAPRRCGCFMPRGYYYFQQQNSSSEPDRQSFFGGTYKFHLCNEIIKIPYCSTVRIKKINRKC